MVPIVLTHRPRPVIRLNFLPPAYHPPAVMPPPPTPNGSQCPPLWCDRQLTSAQMLTRHKASPLTVGAHGSFLPPGCPLPTKSPHTAMPPNTTAPTRLVKMSSPKRADLKPASPACKNAENSNLATHETFPNPHKENGIPRRSAAEKKPNLGSPNESRTAEDQSAWGSTDTT